MPAVIPSASEAPDVFLWRLFKDTSVAQISICVSERRHYVQLEIDGATVFSCGFRPEGGLQPLAALAGTTRQELEARGWNQSP